MTKYVLQYYCQSLVMKIKCFNTIAYDISHCTKVFIIRWILLNDKVFIAILLPVVSDKDKMLKNILTIVAYDKQN